MPNYLTKLTNSLVANDKLTLLEIEGKINFKMILRIKSPVVMRTLKREIGLPALVKYCSLALNRFLVSIGREEDMGEDQMVQFCYDLIEADSTWQLLDVINFFKFVRENQGRKDTMVYGTIDALQLWRIHSHYQLEKATAREMYQEEIRSQYVTGSSERTSDFTTPGLEIKKEKDKKDFK